MNPFQAKSYKEFQTKNIHKGSPTITAARRNPASYLLSFPLTITAAPKISNYLLNAI
jgi:hypothetical protein